MVAFVGKDNGDDTSTFPNSEVRRMYAHIEALLEALDTIHMHGVEREHNWMMVPKTEWEQAFKRVNWPPKPT